MPDPRVDFLDSLSVDEARVKNFPGFIFLCGGPMPERVETRPYLSLRHHLIDHIQANNIDFGAKVVVAEKFEEWLQFDTYTNLITFERHLAGVANVIPIILESPGAMAELGAFSQERAIKEKLLVLMHERFAADASFINYGLIRFIKPRDDDDTFVQTYPWIEPTDGRPREEIDAINSRIVADIANDIAKRVRDNLQETRRFDRNNPGHVMVLIEDLIKLMIGLKLGELVSMLKQVGIEIDATTANQYLFLLQKLGIVGDKHYGSRFYFSNEIWKSHIEYAFKGMAAPFDRAATMQKFEAFYRDQKDKRLNASRAFIASARGKR